MKKTLCILTTFLLLQGCTRTAEQSNFGYEQLYNKYDGNPFRDRRYDYARNNIMEEHTLKVPKNLSSEKIIPQFKLPEHQKVYKANELKKAKKEMQPPLYNEKFDLNKIIQQQTETVFIAINYDKYNHMNLVVREPTFITLDLLNNFFEQNKNKYTIDNKAQNVLSTFKYKVLDKSNNLTYMLLVKKIDNLTTLVGISAVMKNDVNILSTSLDEYTKFLDDIRKKINGLKLSKLQQQQILFYENPKKEKGFGGLLSGKIDGKNISKLISFSSYNETLENKNNSQNNLSQYSKPQDTTYNSDAKATTLN